MISNNLSSFSGISIFDILFPESAAASAQFNALYAHSSSDVPAPAGDPETLGEYAFLELVEVPALWPLKQYP